MQNHAIKLIPGADSGIFDGLFLGRAFHKDPLAQEFQHDHLGHLVLFIARDHRDLMRPVKQIRVRARSENLALLNQHVVERVKFLPGFGHPGWDLDPGQVRAVIPSYVLSRKSEAPMLLDIQLLIWTAWQTRRTVHPAPAAGEKAPGQ